MNDQIIAYPRRFFINMPEFPVAVIPTEDAVIVKINVGDISQDKILIMLDGSRLKITNIANNQCCYDELYDPIIYDLNNIDARLKDQILTLVITKNQLIRKIPLVVDN